MDCPSRSTSILLHVVSGVFRGGGGGGGGGWGPSTLEFKKIINSYIALQFFLFAKKRNMLVHANSNPPFTKSLDPPLRGRREQALQENTKVRGPGVEAIGNARIWKTQYIAPCLYEDIKPVFWSLPFSCQTVLQEM